MVDISGTKEFPEADVHGLESHLIMSMTRHGVDGSEEREFLLGLFISIVDKLKSETHVPESNVSEAPNQTETVILATSIN